MRTISIVRIAALGVALALAMGAKAEQLFIGNDTTSPVQIYTLGGAFVQDFGASGATGSALDGAGHVYTIQPGGSDSVITEYDAAQNPVATIHFTSGIENGNGFPSWIEDMTYGGGGTLWVSGFNGEIYHIDATGAILSSFDSGNTFSGVATDGSFLYTTGGTNDGHIFKYQFDGTLLASIPTAASALGGLGYDSVDGTLWGGSFATIYHFDLAGNTLGSFDTSTSSSFHDGLEVGDIGGTNNAVPEPGTVVLLTSALGMLCFARKFGRRAN